MNAMPLPSGITWFEPTLPLHIFDAPEPGPTALVQAGIHGDEIAGVHALAELLEENLRPTHGRLIVVPVMNPPAYRARERKAPGGLDLNRCFPGDANGEAREQRLARRFMDLVLDERPAIVVTLHESHKRYDPAPTVVGPTFGQSIVYGVLPRPPIVDRTIAAMNAEAAEAEHWSPLYYPVATSSTEVIVDATGCVGLCIETWMGFAQRRRIDMQRRIVELLLADIGVRRVA